MDQSTNQTFFRPAQVGRASEDVALQIEAAILGGQLRMGERLPSERKLQGVFRSSRGVIREALRALKQKGLIEIKKGAHGGAYIKNLELINASEPLALFLKQQQVSFEFLIEFRESMDRTIAMLACSRGQQPDKQALVEMTVHFEVLITEPEPDMKIIAEMDRKMNLALVRMTGNPIFEMIMRMTQIGFSSQDQVLYEDPAFRFKTAANWCETARQVAAGEVLKAVSSVSYHYVLLQRCLEKKHAEAGDPADDLTDQAAIPAAGNAASIWPRSIKTNPNPVNSEKGFNGC